MSQRLIKTILLVGPPNSGKTSLFNTLTKSKHKTVNYPGSTVDCAVGKLSDSVFIVDTPGIQSLKAHSLDEEVTVKTLLNPHHVVAGTSQCPDLIVLVLDASQLERQLSLVRQFQRLDISFMVVLSKKDLEGKVFPVLDIAMLEAQISQSTHFISTSSKPEVAQLSTAMIERLSDTHCPLNIEKGIGHTLDDYAWAEATYAHITTSLEVNRTFDLDKWILHPFLGPILFLATMVLFFWMIFAFAGPFMDAIDTFFSYLVDILHTHLPDHWLRPFLSDGIVGGLGAVFVFVPQIFILFFAMGLMESSGYLARGAVLVDRPLSAVGLSGKSFVPLLSGCACAIPAMMAARTIPNKKERLVTLFVIPLMTCSARLPVYGLLLSLLLRESAPWVSSLAMTGIYVASVSLASVVAAIAARIVGLKSQQSNFDIELPLWHRPAFRNTVLNAFDQTWSFCKNAGPTILMVAIALWALSVFPNENHSFIHIISNILEPLLRPMGVDGRVGVALILSFAAREVFVSALALIFAIDEGNALGLLSTLQHATFEGSSQPIFTSASILGLIVFFMISMQCMATLAIAKKEMGGWKLPALMTVIYTASAYILSVLIVQLLQ